MIGVAAVLAWCVFWDEAVAVSSKRSAEAEWRAEECQMSMTTPCQMPKAPQLLQRMSVLENRDWPVEVPAMDESALLDRALLDESALLDTELGRAHAGGGGAGAGADDPRRADAPTVALSPALPAPFSQARPAQTQTELLQELSEELAAGRTQRLPRPVDAAGAGRPATPLLPLGAALLDRARRLEAYAQGRRAYAQTQLAQTQPAVVGQARREQPAQAQLAQAQSVGQALGVGEETLQKAAMAGLVVLLLLLVCVAECGKCGGVRQASQMDELAAEVRRVRHTVDAMRGRGPKAVVK